MARKTAKRQDPRQAGVKPPFAGTDQEYPGTDAEMQPKADHGEKSYKGHSRLKGMTTLITGGDSGIGRAVALAFAREGADVLISYISEHEDAEETARWVEQAGQRAVLAGGDIQDEEHCKALVQRAIDEFGRLDILVNNAAFQMARDDIAEISTDEFDRTFRTNVYAMFYLCKAALPHMQAGASIINTASIQGYNPSPQLLAYAPTKAAIINFSKALARQVIRKGIRVNVVAPGPVWTPLIPSTMPDDYTREFGGSSAFGRPAQPAELAPIYVLLASPESSFVTAEVYGATGGKTPY